MVIRGQFGNLKESEIAEHSETRDIAFVGLDRAGKTTTLKRMSRGILVETRPTLGLNTENFSILGLRFRVFDLGGQDSYQVFWERFIPQQEAVVFFIDASDHKRLAKVRLALSKTLSLVKKDASVMILANKQDLPDALDLPDLINALDLSLVPRIKNLQFFAVSAKTGAGLYEAFQWLAETLDLDISDQKCTLYGFSIYQKDIGLPVLTTPFGIPQNSDNPWINQDSLMLTSLHSAINKFANEVVESDLKSIQFEVPKINHTFQIVSVGRGGLTCLLVTDGSDSDLVASTLGELLLESLRDKLKSLQEGEKEHLDLVEIITTVKPLVKNIEHLKTTLMSQETIINVDSIDEEEEGLFSEPHSSIDSIEAILSNEGVTEEGSGQISSDTLTNENQTEVLPPRPAHNLSPDSAHISSQEDKKEVKTDQEHSDEDFFFRMGVAERIKYLQQKHKRLQ